METTAFLSDLTLTHNFMAHSLKPGEMPKEWGEAEDVEWTYDDALRMAEESGVPPESQERAAYLLMMPEAVAVVGAGVAAVGSMAWSALQSIPVVANTYNTTVGILGMQPWWEAKRQAAFGKVSAWTGIQAETLERGYNGATLGLAFVGSTAKNLIGKGFRKGAEFVSQKLYSKGGMESKGDVANSNSNLNVGREPLDAREAFAKADRVRKINNRMPINAEYAGKVYPLEKLPESLRQKYPHSVAFTGTGHPDFSRYAIKKVQIEVTGGRIADERAANRAAGLRETPENFTWHHHHDGGTMQLIPEDLHFFVKHTGGVAIVKQRKTKND